MLQLCLRVFRWGVDGGHSGRNGKELTHGKGRNIGVA